MKYTQFSGRRPVANVFIAAGLIIAPLDQVPSFQGRGSLQFVYLLFLTAMVLDLFYIHLVSQEPAEKRR